MRPGVTIMDALQITSISLGILVSVLVILAGFYRLLLPKLRQDLSEPIKRIEDQLTVNGGTSAQPTVPDRFAALDRRLDEVTMERRESDRRWDAWRSEHLAWSHAQIHLLWAHILGPADPPVPPPPKPPSREDCP